MNKSNNRRSIILSVTALLVVFVLVIGISFSWSEGGSRGYVYSPEITISSGSQLTILADADTEGRIKIPTEGLNLAEVSSADGRNFFFPTIYNSSHVTTAMTFREGIPSDENTKYLSYDFDIEGGDTNTNVYLGAGTVVQCKNKDVMSALRIAIFSNDGSAPYAIFRPNQMAGVPDSYSPIATITAVGVPTVLEGDNEVATKPFGDYYYGNAQNQYLFKINSGELKHLTVAMWLEGTELTGDFNTYKDVEVKLNLDLTTNADTLTKYNFVDNTRGYTSGELESWVTNTNKRENDSTDYPTMMYVYDNNKDRYYAMTQITDYKTSEGTELSSWSIYIPDSINNFTFRRYSPDIDNWWNEWNPSMTDIKTDANNERTFIAICGNGASEGNELSGCYGYWKDASGKIRLYFQKETYWENLHCYAWVPDGPDSDTDPDPSNATGSWPGKSMTFVKNVNNDNSKPLYYVDLNEEENILGVQFNNGVSTEIYFSPDFGYTHVYAYDSNGDTLLGAWPGTQAVTDASGLLKVTIKTNERNKSFNVQFNNGTNQKQFEGLSGETGNLYAWENSNSLKPATVVYFGKNYGDSTHVFVQKSDKTIVLGDWPGRKINKDTATGLYKLVFGYDTKDSELYFIVNNGSAGENNQYPWGTIGYMGYTGNMYNFYEDYFKTVPQEYNLNVDKYLFNGSLLWYKNNGEHGVNVYLGQENSLIYPHK